MCISEKILNWFRPDDRALPWRKTKNSYAIWVSEIMLQQTQANTVIPYYERFMEKFPTVKDLACAEEEAVLKMWEGLGYYRRARHLLEASKIVAKKGMPSNYKGLKELPGIGEYTAAAIASIAFDEPVAAIDGNLTRIYSRLYAVEEIVDKAEGKRKIARLANADISKKRPGDFNQAMMDLGNRICTPNNPHCLLCPLRENCEALRRGIAEDLPHKTPTKKQKKERHTLLILDFDGRFLIRKRTRGVLSSMWGFPLLPGHLGKEDLSKFLSERDFVVKNIEKKSNYRHIFSHKIWDIDVVYIALDALLCAEDGNTWADREALRKTYAIPSAFQPALEVIDAMD